jgi:hypothetical protein
MVMARELIFLLVINECRTIFSVITRAGREMQFFLTAFPCKISLYLILLSAVHCMTIHLITLTLLM